MAKILITGVAGFLGNHLARYHLTKGDEVVGIDDFSTAMSRESKHIVELENNENFSLIECSITDDWIFDHLKNDPEPKKFDLIYNLACPASPPKYASMPIHTIMTCVQGTKNVLDLAKKHEAKVVHASTSEVYGEPNISPQPESYWGNVNSFGCRSMYDEGKRCAEALCWTYLNEYNVDVRIARIFNTYGEYMDPDDGRVITNFVKQILTGNDVTVYGDGNQTRSFCYASDTISALVKLGSIKKNPKTPINVGNPIEYTIAQIAMILLEMIPHHNAKIIYKPLPGDDPTQRKPDITLAKKHLNWQPKVELQDGLAKTIEWIKIALTA